MQSIHLDILVNTRFPLNRTVVMLHTNFYKLSLGIRTASIFLGASIYGFSGCSTPIQSYSEEPLLPIARAGESYTQPIYYPAENEEVGQPQQDFTDFLRDLANTHRIPSSGIRRTPTFGGIGQTAPARY